MAVTEVEKVGESREEFVDFVRAYAIILVVMVHASGPILYNYNGVSTSTWMWANIYDAFARTCVPLFVMVSGYLLLNPKVTEDHGAFLRKRGWKVFLPYLFWAVFYLVWKGVVRSETVTVRQGVQQLIGGIPDYHLVFISILIGLYLLTPGLRLLFRYGDTALIVYFIKLWLVVVVLNFFANRFVGVSLNSYVQVTPFFLGYFLLGGLFRRTTYGNTARQLVACALLVLAAWYLTAAMTYLVTKDDGVLDETFYAYISPNVVVMSVCSFAVLKSAAVVNAWARSGLVRALVVRISQASFGVYLTHVVLLDLFSTGYLADIVGLKFVLTGTSFHPAVAIPFLTVLVVTICTIVVLYAQRIPLVRKLVPQ